MSSRKNNGDCVSICDDSSDDDDSDDEENHKQNNKKMKTKNKGNKKKESVKVPFNLGYSCKHGALTFVLFILLMSDVFIERVMGKTKMNLVEGRTPTKKGICVIGLCLVMGMILLGALLSFEKI